MTTLVSAPRIGVTLTTPAKVTVASLLALVPIFIYLQITYFHTVQLHMLGMIGFAVLFATVVLVLENNDPARHSFDVDELGVHVPVAGGKTSLAVIKADKPGTYTFYCAPHYHKASGNGMNGKLVVEP